MAEEEERERDREQVTIGIAGLVVRTHHGVTEAEREVGQRLVFDLELRPARCGAVGSDLLEETADYGALADLIGDIAAERRFKTLERLAGEIADRIEAEQEHAGLRLRITKSEPPFSAPTGAASVELARPGS